MYAENGGMVKKWSSGYTDNGNVRTWKLDYTFSGAGNRSITFKASNDGKNYDNGKVVKVTVNTISILPSDLKTAQVVSVHVEPEYPIVHEDVIITVITTQSTQYLAMYYNGYKVKTWQYDYTDADPLRKWTLTHQFGTVDSPYVTFRASADNITFDNGITEQLALNPTFPIIYSASFKHVTAKEKQNVDITVKTSSNATTLAMCAENGSIVKTWDATDNSSVRGNVRTWKVTYAFNNEGSRKIAFKASSASGYGSTVTTNIMVTK